MRKLNWFDKFLFLVNSFVAFALLLSYLLPHVAPIEFPILSVLSLGVPLLLLANIFFVLFWAIRLKWQFLLSFIILLAGYNYLAGWIQFSEKNFETDNSLSIMSYNVRMFNAYNWVDDKEIPQKISRFIKEKDPDVLVTQEHYAGVAGLTQEYPYSFVHMRNKGAEFGMAVFSKFPIVNKQSVDFPGGGNNNAIFVDVVKNGDTIRFFNVHFQSLNIKPGLQDIKDADSKQLAGRIGFGFGIQQNQAKVLMEEVTKSPYKTIILGDFNNTAFSYNYRYIKGDNFRDAFLEAGSGFGQTFNLNYFPLRIDFILVDKNIPIQYFNVYRIDYSDHFPLMTRIEW